MSDLPDAPPARRSKTLGDLVAVYLEDRLRRGEIRPITVRDNRYTLNQFAEVAGGRRPVERLGPSDIERWLGSIGHLGPATRRGRYSCVKGYCRWLVRQRHIRRDPTAELKAPRAPRTVPRGLTIPAVGAVLTEGCPDTRAVAIVTLMVQQGLRCCEVSRLQLGDYDRLNGLMRVIGKGSHERVLPIVAETARAIDDYLAEYPAFAGPLIRTYTQPTRQLKPESIVKLVRVWVRAAGVKRAPHDGVSAHAFRHTAATDMLRSGAHVRDVQAALGHAHLVTTERYLPHLVGTLAEAMGGRSYRGSDR